MPWPNRIKSRLPRLRKAPRCSQTSLVGDKAIHKIRFGKKGNGKPQNGAWGGLSAAAPRLCLLIILLRQCFERFTEGGRGLITLFRIAVDGLHEERDHRIVEIGAELPRISSRAIHVAHQSL